MRKKDLRAEQINLLRFEKTIEKASRDWAAGKPLIKTHVLAALPTLAAASAIAAQKLGDEAPLRQAAEIEAAVHSPLTGDAWLIELAEIVTTSHNMIETLAESGAFVLLRAAGTPKKTPTELVQLLLTNGLS